MKIYKKILNLGYGICCLLPLIILFFTFIGLIKDIGNNNVIQVANIDTLSDYFVKTLLRLTNEKIVRSVEWFQPFKQFNSFIYGLGNFTSLLEINDKCYFLVFVLFYTEWVVLVSFFRLFGSVFGCMINFADRMLDKIGGTN